MHYATGSSLDTAQPKQRRSKLPAPWAEGFLPNSKQKVEKALSCTASISPQLLIPAALSLSSHHIGATVRITTHSQEYFVNAMISSHSPAAPQLPPYVKY